MNVDQKYLRDSNTSEAAFRFRMDPASRTKTFSWENGVRQVHRCHFGSTDHVGNHHRLCERSERVLVTCSTQTVQKGQYVDCGWCLRQIQDQSALDWGEYQLIESKAPDGYDHRHHSAQVPHRARWKATNIAGQLVRELPTSILKATSRLYRRVRPRSLSDGGAIKNTAGRGVCLATGGN